MICEDVIEKIRLSNDIESVIRDYLPDLKRAGRNWRTCCPFHDEKTPSFLVSPEKGIFKCFGCNAAGDVFKFVMLADNISWYEAVKKLAEKAGIEIQETKQDTVKISEKVELFRVLEVAAAFYNDSLLKNADAKNAREYLSKRGVTSETVNKFKLGYAIGGRLLELASKKGYATSTLLKAGLITKRENGDFFEYMSERIVFPIFDVQGRIIAFGGRTILDRSPKYLNTPETAVYSKSANLYGLFQTLPVLRKERKIIVLEGYMDAIISQQFGVIGAVATLGTAFTQNQAKLVSRYSDFVTLLFDSDDAGKNASQKALEALAETGIECRVSALPEHVDADEYLNEYGEKKFFDVLENSSKSAIDFMIARVCGLFTGREKTAEVKANIVSSLLGFVVKSSNIIVQREWIKSIAQNIKVDEEAVWEEFKKKRQFKFKDDSRYDKDSASHVYEDKEASKVVSMSREEIFLNLVLDHRDYIRRVDCGCFEDARCKKVFNLAASGLNDAKILNRLPKEDENWFSELRLIAVKYSDIEEAFSIISREIEVTKCEGKRQEYSGEILLMDVDKKEKDEKIFDEYKKLTAFLKGSER